MKEVSYRSIFPDNNIPTINFQVKHIALKDKLSLEVSSLVNHINVEYFSAIVKNLEFKVKIKEDPINALLEKLSEISKESPE